MKLNIKNFTKEELYNDLVRYVYLKQLIEKDTDLQTGQEQDLKIIEQKYSYR